MNEQNERKDSEEQDVLMTTREAAEYLGVTTTHRVTQLIRQGRLEAEKWGRDWMIRKSALDNIKDVKMGRPKKSTD